MALFSRGGDNKKEALKEETPKKSPQFQGLSMGKILWAGFLVIAIITLLSGYTSYLLYAERIDENRADRQQAIAERAAAVFAAKLELLTASIERTLNDDAIQAELNELPADSITPPERLQRRLKEQLHLLTRQVIVGPDTVPNDAIAPPLSYACLELPSLKKPTLELHRFGTSDQHLDIAFPISNSRSLLLSFDTQLAPQWLNTINHEDSHIILQQQIGGHSPLTFAQRGDARLTGSTHSTTRPIPGTQFQVAVSLPEIEPLTQIERVLFFANFAVALLLIALTLSATLMTLRLILKKDLRTISSIIKRSSVNLHHILPIKLAELRGCAEEIKQQLGIDQIEAAEAEQKQEKRDESEIPLLFQPEIVVDVEPEIADDNEPTDEKN